MIKRVGYLGCGLAAVALIAISACSSTSSSSAPTTTAAKSPSTTAAATAPVLSATPSVTQLASTVPANGDVNPYGIAVVTQSAGRLVAGATLVSNFNDKGNVQGTGTTIVEVDPSGTVSTFSTITSLPPTMPCPGGIGLTTALDILPGGYVVVGSLAAGPGGALPEVNPAGCLIVLNSAGTPVATWTGPDINGPWDMTMATTPTGVALFVSNALTGRPAGTSSAPPVSGICNIVRIDVADNGTSVPTITSTTVVGSGYPWKADPTAFVLSPTGLALGANGTLYVAETMANQITAIPDAVSRTTAVANGQNIVTTGGSLNGPLGMTVASNGDLLVANGGDGNVVEVTPAGQQVVTSSFVANGAGDLFGLTLAPGGQAVLFVNDGTNALDSAAITSSLGAVLKNVGAAAPSSFTVSLAKGPQGIFLIGPSGRTLYFRTTDHGTTSSCTAGCATVWPALTATGSLTAAPGITGTQVATATGQVPDQVTYFGHLLYYFSGDTAPGQTNVSANPTGSSSVPWATRCCLGND